MNIRIRVTCPIIWFILIMFYALGVNVAMHCDLYFIAAERVNAVYAATSFTFMFL